MSIVKISAADVKRLRDKTGAGMMDCKKALKEANGDFDAAIEFLRKKGQKMTEKRADRDAKEGVVIAQTSEDKTNGIVVRVSCETDFVAKNEDFIAFVQSVANTALAALPADKAALLATEINGTTIADLMVEKTGVIGEKIELTSYEKVEATSVAAYIHMGYKVGVLVGFNQEVSEEIGKNLTMQVAFTNPMSLDKDGVDAATIEKELEIARDQARQQGKPEQIIERIAQGKLNAFYKEHTLLHQEYVKESKTTVTQYLQRTDKNLTITDYKRLALG